MTYTVSLGGDKTVAGPAEQHQRLRRGLDAQINAAQNGINIQSRVSGSSFSIGENGGTTATQLGIRTFTAGHAAFAVELRPGRGREHGLARRD